jgi:hypothetical protein
VVNTLEAGQEVPATEVLNLASSHVDNVAEWVGGLAETADNLAGLKRFISKLEAKQEEVTMKMIALSSSSADDTVPTVGNDSADGDCVDATWLCVEVTKDGGGDKMVPHKGDLQRMYVTAWAEWALTIPATLFRVWMARCLGVPRRHTLNAIKMVHLWMLDGCL